MDCFICTDTLSCVGEVNEDAVSYCERFLELVTDLEAQLPTRRFFNTLLNDSHLVVLTLDILALCMAEQLRIWLTPSLSCPLSLLHLLPSPVPRSAATYPVLPAESQRGTYSNRYGTNYYLSWQGISSLLLTLHPLPPSPFPPFPSLPIPTLPLSQLLGRLKFYTGFEISDQTGSALTDHEMTDIHYNKITSLQVASCNYIAVCCICMMVSTCAQVCWGAVCSVLSVWFTESSIQVVSRPAQLCPQQCSWGGHKGGTDQALWSTEVGNSSPIVTMMLLVINITWPHPNHVLILRHNYSTN